MFSILNQVVVPNIKADNEERASVPLPTPIAFPDYAAHCRESAVTWTSEPGSHGDFARAPDFQRIFTKIRRIPDADLLQWQTLNLTVKDDCTFEDLLPEASNDAVPLLPPKKWLKLRPQESEAPATSPLSSHHVLSPNMNVHVPNDDRSDSIRVDRAHDQFYFRVKELLYDNDVAISSLDRSATVSVVPGVQTLHYRKFWESLSLMGQYWDDSKDVYIPPAEDATKDTEHEMENIDPSRESISQDSDEPRKKAKQSHDPPSIKFARAKPSVLSVTFQDKEGNVRFAEASAFTPGTPRNNEEAKAQFGRIDSPLVPEGTYKGRRVGTGADMPESLRTDVVNHFIGPICAQLMIMLIPHGKQPVLQVGSMNVPVRVSTAAWSRPTTREKARAGITVGPMMGVWCRGDTALLPLPPSTDHETDVKGKAPLDSSNSVTPKFSHPVLTMLSEASSILCIAAERLREGKVASSPGDGKWYTSKPRFGQKPKDDAHTVAALQAAGASETHIDRAKRIKALKQKLSPLEAWANIRPGLGVWDRTAEYKAIGRPDQSKPEHKGWDEIFMISSLNRHICVVKLRVHEEYMNYLTTARFPTNEELEKLPDDWCKPVMSRTKWFDLFVAEDRGELTRGIWGVLAWLTRTL